MLISMSKDEAKSLLNLGANRNEIPKRFLLELERIMFSNMTDAEVAASVKNELYSVSDSIGGGKGRKGGKFWREKTN